MADGRLDPFDVGALERAVNDSATRVSGLWLSFVAFSAYLAAAASMISHRQIFLEEPIKLPTINIDLPLVASAILLPLLFVIYHVFVLVQVVLLARTADAYNQAVDRAMAESEGRTAVRQRLANTLFAQLFAGSPREREGVLGWLLRLMAWITLAIAPVFVLIVFEVKLLPFHSPLITWTHRALIACDLAAVLFLWAGAIKPGSDIQWRSLRPHWRIAGGALLVLIACCFLITYPGEPTRAWTRLITPAETWREESLECRLPPALDAVLKPGFDRIVLVGDDFVDNDRLDKIVKLAIENGLRPHETERTRSFRGRDLRCARLAGTDLSHSEFISADLSGASLKAAHLEGSTFSGANLSRADLDGARLQGSWFGAYPMADGTLVAAARMPHVYARKAQLQGANLAGIDFEESQFDEAILSGADLSGATLSRSAMNRVILAGADLNKAHLQGLSLGAVDLRGVDLEGAELQQANLNQARLDGANLTNAHLQGTRLANAQMQGANLYSAQLQGVRLDESKLMGATFELARMEGANLSSADLRGVMAERANLAGADLSTANLQGATFKDATLSGASLSGAQLGFASFENARLQAVVLVDAKLAGTFLGGTRLQGAKLASSELAGAVLAKAFLWRAYLTSAQDCSQAQVSEPILEAAWDYARYTRGGQGTALREISQSIVDDFLRERVEKIPAESREQLRTALNALLAPETQSQLRANTAMWQRCADGTTGRSQQSTDQLKTSYETRLAEYLLTLMCAEGTETKYLANGIVTYRIKTGSPALAEAFARAFVRLPEKGCPAAAQIDEATKATIRSYLPKRPGG